MQIIGEDQYDSKYPAGDYKKTITSLTIPEIRELQPYDAIIKMSSIAEVVMNQVLNNKVLPRLGVKTSKDVGVLYDVPSAQIIIWEPRVWCSSCNARRAEYRTPEGATYCSDCYAKIAVPELKKTEKKKKK